MILGWHFGSACADGLEGKKKMDERTAKTTRMMYQAKGIGVGGIVWLVIGPTLFAWLRARERNQEGAEQPPA